MAALVLAPDHQRILSVLESEAGSEGMRCQQLAVVWPGVLTALAVSAD
ncbi:hypothetical protein [Streptomyces sp. NBC_00564]|nr:hypothetical protein OG256_46015 [Streptomyces sp. NBC_00564]